MKRLTPACRLVLYSLWHKRDYFSRKNKLDKDGSFYYDDKRLSEDSDLSEKTIPRVRRFLVEKGFIRVKIGLYKGNATKYWVCRKPDKKSPFIPLLKVDNLPAEVDNPSSKAPQNVLINKVINKENNKEDVLSFEELKNGIIGLAKSNGASFARRFYLDKGVLESDINKALDSMPSSARDTGC